MIPTALTHLCLLAEDAANDGGGLGGLLHSPLPMIVMILALGYFVFVRPERQKQATHKQMLANLKKSDRVVTIGGIKGIVANVHREADEVTVNVDESTGTKIRVTLSSIARIESGETEAEKK